jgi:hypothetical protein
LSGGGGRRRGGVSDRGISVLIIFVVFFIEDGLILLSVLYI